MLTEFRTLFTISVIFTAQACLSNPSLQCSPSAQFYSPSGSFDYSCQPQASSSSDIYQSGQYNGFLGEGVQARAYSGNAKESSDFVTSDIDLRCHDDESCKWHNDLKDELDWVRGSGNVDPAKLALITGSNTLPKTWFLILASDTKPSFHSGSLVSPPIGCQQSSGLLSFRMWRSRSHAQHSEPDIDICTRRIPEQTLENCLTVEVTENHTIIASIPPILEPFEIVLRGYDFSNEPEGGLLILDDIDYFAHIDRPENCVPKHLDSEADIEPFNEPASGTNSGNSSDIDDAELTSLEGLLSTTTIVYYNDYVNDTSCRSLQCALGSDPPCNYTMVGEGSRGNGFTLGWKVLTAPNNVANRLTGIHASPANKEENEFLAAEFPGFERVRHEHKFVLESPKFLLPQEKPAFLGFFKYLSTQGVELSICEDTQMKQCFWDNFLHSAEPFARSWTAEIVKIPKNINKFYVVCTQDVATRANVGQVGLAGLALYADPEGEQKLC